MYMHPAFMHTELFYVKDLNKKNPKQSLGCNVSFLEIINILPQFAVKFLSANHDLLVDFTFTGLMNNGLATFFKLFLLTIALH